MKNLIKTYNVADKINSIKNLLINECLSQRINLDESYALNFKVNSKFTNYLYDIFYNICVTDLNKFTLKDNNFKLWCYLSDKDFNKGRWHNHIETSTINSVLYLKTQNKGIRFRHKNKKIHMLPKENDLLIFPSFLEHFPDVSKNKPRITLNLELRCNETAESIFNV